jgi:hypothetical protein
MGSYKLLRHRVWEFVLVHSYYRKLENDLGARFKNQSTFDDMR